MKEHIINIRSDTIYKFQVILKELKGDVKHCRGEKKNLEYAIDVMSRKAKNSMDEILIDNSYLKKRASVFITGGKNTKTCQQDSVLRPNT